MSWSALPLIAILTAVIYFCAVVYFSIKIRSELWSVGFLILTLVVPFGIAAGF